MDCPPWPFIELMKHRAKGNEKMTIKFYLRTLILFSVFYVSAAQAQKRNAAFEYHIHKASSGVTIDGKMDEKAWADAEVARQFFMVLPMDTSYAKVLTDVRMTYDQENLYILVENHLAKAGRYVVESLRRDFVFGKNDNFLLFMDPFDDQTNGFSFGANAAGAQWDGQMYNGGAVDLNWDNKWESRVMNYPDRWIFEAAIPFKTIRYKKGIKQWGINFSRLDVTMAEKSSWAPVPRQFPTASLAYSGILVWDEPPPQAGSNISIIPYALGGISKDYEHKTPIDYRTDVGVDAKIAVTSSLNLDLTVHPDFSQVEVDQQVTNLDRYELFFPEKRQFFLENGDMFANYGYANIRPFFSRRIGLDAPISFGARLSGKLNKDWRIGAMDMQTQKVSETGLPSNNYAVIALQRRVFSRSNIGVIFVNKNAFNYTPGMDSSKPVYNNYNRNIGLEYNLASSNNKWTGKAMLLKSFTPGTSTKDWSQAANLQFSSRKWLIAYQHEFVGANYNAEVGYVPRKDYIGFFPFAQRLFFPKKGPVLSHGPRLSTTYVFNTNWHQTDQQTQLTYYFNFRDQSVLDFWTSYSFVELQQPFDPTNSGKDSLASGTHHQAYTWGFDYASKPQQLFTYALSGRYGGWYDDGKRTFVTAILGYRFQPFVNITMNASFNHLDLPQPWGITDFWLIGPRIDVTFTNKLFFTTFLQYNDQQKNVNLNTRFQWRYRPASDLFIVYTDNYFSTPLGVRNRAVVLKLTYWWNI